MSDDDRRRWDSRYVESDRRPLGRGELPAVFVPFEGLFETSGSALEVACGEGRAAIWLADRGMDVWGIDGSPVAINRARDHAEALALTGRCHFDVVDLDRGLPDGPLVDVIVCHLYRNEALYPRLVDRLTRGGLLAIAVLSEVDASPGRFRARPGELHEAFNDLDVVADGEEAGTAWLVARHRK